MSQKTVIAHVYGKEYALACDVGQEQHLQQLIADVNRRTLELEQAVGKLPEALMLLYTGLMIADELHDSRRDLARARDELARTQETLARTEKQLAESSADERFAAMEEGVAENLYAVARRMEGLAEKLAA